MYDKLGSICCSESENCLGQSSTLSIFLIKVEGTVVVHIRVIVIVIVNGDMD